ncbi:MAG TPA: hypothetical protein VMB26_18240 [Candidatus Binataceae bacterium]|nr:hypothetical protein [Candidatus Binataceae bacterium]
MRVDIQGARNVGFFTTLLPGFYALATLASLSFVMPAAAQGPSINGVYDLPAIGEQIPKTILTNARIDGIAIRVGWSAVEPADGVYDWSGVDALIQQVTAEDKKVSINVEAGWKTPSWLYVEGAQGFNFIWDKAWGPAFCSIVTIPVPWDPVFLAKWEDFVAAFGAKYGSNSLVSHVKLTGINYETGDTLLPSNSAENPIHGGKCLSNNDTKNWLAIGYTRTKVENAWLDIAAAFNAAFPEREFAGMFAPGGFPPIDDDGKRISGSTVDRQLSLDLINQGEMVYGRGRFIAQSNGLSATYIYSGVADAAAYVNTGYQMVGVMGLSLWSAAIKALDADAMFLEIYETDLTNPRLAPIVGSAHSYLLDN